MGLGIIAGSLLLSFFEIPYLPNYLLLLIEMIGFISIYKRIKHPYIPVLLVSNLFLFFTCFIETTSFSFFLISFIRKVLIYKMIYDISKGYSKHRLYFITIMIDILIWSSIYIYMYLHQQTTFTLNIYSLWLYVILFLEIYIIYHIFKINNYLWANLEEITQVYPKRSDAKKKIVIILFIISLLGFSTFKDVFIHQSLTLNESSWFALIGHDETLFVSGIGAYANETKNSGDVYLPEVFLNRDIRKQGAKSIYVEYTFQDKVLAASYQKIKLKSSNNYIDSVYDYEHYMCLDIPLMNISRPHFPGIEGSERDLDDWYMDTNQSYKPITREEINDYKLHLDEFRFSYIIYDQDDQIMYQGSFKLENAINQTLSYEDAMFKLSNMYVSKYNTVIKMPDLQIKSSHSFNRVNLYLKEENGAEYRYPLSSYSTYGNQKYFKEEKPLLGGPTLTYESVIIRAYDYNNNIVLEKEIFMEVTP